MAYGDPKRVKVSPVLAQKLLGTIDASLYRWRGANYLRLLADMEHDEFNSLNSIPLILDEDGRLYNGRHRLTAQVDLDLTYPYYVRTLTAPDAAQAARDGDHPASWMPSDHFKMAGHANRFQLASGLTWMWRYANGTVKARPQASHQTSYDILARHPGIEEWISLVLPASNRFKLSGGHSGAIAYLGVKFGMDTQQMVQFWTDLALVGKLGDLDAAEKLIELGETSPIVALANALNNNMPNQRKGRRRADGWADIITIKAINTFFASESIRQMRGQKDFPPLLGVKQGSKFAKLVILGEEDA
jgi:hypothetical protein